MSKFDDNFTDSNEFTTYQLDITSENGEALTFDDLTTDQIRQIVDLAEELTAEPEEPEAETSDEA